MKKKFISILTIALMVFGATAQKSKSTALSLKGAVDYAAKNNPQARLSELNVEMAKKDVQKTAAMGLPQVNASGSFQNFLDIPTQVLPDFISPTVIGTLVSTGLLPPDAGDNQEEQFIAAQFGTDYSTSVGLTASQLILDGRYIYGLKASRAYVNYVNLENQKKERDVRDQVTLAYYGALIAQENLKIYEASKANIDKTLLQTTAYYEQGFMEDVDVDQLKLMKSNVETNIQNAKNQLETSMIMLKFSMGMPLDEELELTDKLESLVDEEQADQIMLQQLDPGKHLDIMLIDEGINLQKINMRVNQSAYFPTVNAFFNHSQNNLSNDLKFEEWFPSTVWGINLNVPLFTSFSTRSAVQQTKIDIDRMEVQRAQLDQSLKLGLSRAKSDFYASLSTYRNQKDNLALAKKIRDKTLLKYNSGMASSLELTQAENQLLQTQGSYIGSLFSLMNAKINMDKALGN